MTLTAALDFWQGDGGDAYARRNPVTAADCVKRAAALARVLRHAAPLPESVLEVGCGVGANLIALSHITTARLFAVEPNAASRQAAVAALPTLHAAVFDGHASAIPAGDASFDLAMTAGVLIHVPPEALRDAMRELIRVARRHVLAVEYFAPQEEPIQYYGDVRIWRRDYGKLYADLGLLPVYHDFFWRPEDGFDNCVAWLLRKEGG